MCTLIVLDRVVPSQPLVVASNRDEYLARPASEPTRISPERDAEGKRRPDIVAPWDLKQGGTWMGVNARGLFVGLTNRRTEAKKDNTRSRGLLVRDALGQTTAASVARELDHGLNHSYNPFHLLYADGHRSFLTLHSADGTEMRELGPGIHVVGNTDPSERGGKVGRVRESLAALDLEAPMPKLLQGLTDVLASHDGDSPLEQTCIHAGEYGTRSSALMTIGLDRWRYWHAEGPPCQTKFQNYSRLLDEIQIDPPERKDLCP